MGMTTAKQTLQPRSSSKEGNQATTGGQRGAGCKWLRTTIGEVADLLTGFPFSSSGYAESGVLLVRGSNVKRGTLDWNPEITQYWPRIPSDLSRYELSPGDIVVAMDGALVGRSFAQIGPHDVPSLLLQRVARLRGRGVNQRLLLHWISSDAFVRHVDSVKTHTAIPHISPHDIRSMPLELAIDGGEQEAIASALSDVDGLIASLDRLIAKKRAIKQAAMQQLLTGKTRLPGFRGKWSMRTLESLAEIDSDNLGASTSPLFEFRYLSLEDVERGAIRSWSEQIFRSAPSRARRRIQDHDIVFATVRPNLKSHVLIPDGFGRAVCSTGFAVVRCTPTEAAPEFVFAQLFTHGIERQVEAVLAGSNYPAINSRDVKRLTVPAPDVEEQTAIGRVLGDMDGEIAALERRRNKAKSVKQAMMQALLTGRIRLPVAAAIKEGARLFEVEGAEAQP